MRTGARSLLLGAIAAALIALGGTPAVAETQGMEAGQPAPAGGVWMDDVTAEHAAQDLDQARKTAAELEVARSVLAERATQVEDLVKLVAELKAAVQNLQGQAATSARLDEVRTQVDEITTKALQLAASGLDSQLKINEANLRVLEQSNKALETANAEIARLRNRGMWDDFKSLLFGVAAFFAGKVIF